MARDLLAPGLRLHVHRYGLSHQNAVNIGLHFVGIPVLLIASLGLLAQLALPAARLPPVLRPNAAWLALLVACVWYFYFDWRFGLVTWTTWAVAYGVGSQLSLGTCIALFLGGAATHLIGHFVFEGKPLAFFRRPVSVFEGPAWLIATWARADGAARLV